MNNIEKIIDEIRVVALGPHNEFNMYHINK